MPAPLNIADLGPEFRFGTSGRYVRVDRASSHVETIKRDYALRDAKDREIGGRVDITREEPTPNAESKTGCDWIGDKFGARPQATRNGVAYGASQRAQYFDTIEQARAYAEGYFTKAAKRAGRK